MGRKRRRRPPALRALVPVAAPDPTAGDATRQAPDDAAAPPSPPPAVHERYDLAEAADLLGVSVSALRRRAAAGAIAFTRGPDGSLRVSRDELTRHAATYVPRHAGRPPEVPDEVVARIADLRAEGLSYARIGALLTLESVPTAHGGRRWWPSTVRAVLIRRAHPPSA